jgi:hexulose-6-phosphate isomerase
MKKSIGNNLIPKSMSFEDGLALTKKAGYDGIELWLEGEGYFSMQTSEAQARTLKSQVNDHGLEVSNVSTTLHWETPFSARDARVRQQAADIVRRQIDMAKIMGTDEVLVVAGLVTPEVTYSECYQRCVDALAPLGPEARRAGVTIGLENCNAEQRFLMGPKEFREFVDRIGAGFGAHLDVGNIHDTGFPEDWVEELGPRIARVHVKDTLRQRGRGGGSVYTNIFLGDNNWPAIMRALRKVGYNGYLIAEMESRYRYCPDQQFYDTSAGLSRLIALT